MQQCPSELSARENLKAELWCAGGFPCHELGFLPITPAPADGLSCRALGTGSRGLHSSHHCADMGIRKMSATALDGG